MGKCHLIMPMGGTGSRFFKQGFMQPKPLIEIEGKPFFYWSTMSVKKYVDIESLTFVILQKHVDEFEIDKKILKYFPDAKIEILPKVLLGPVFTALKGVEDIADGMPVIINDCDHMFRCAEINRVLNSGMFKGDGALLTFISNEPQFSYIKFDENNKVIGTIEKEVVSSNAICGAYVFKNVQVFKKIAKQYINECPYNECFMSGLYNVMCGNKMDIHNYLLDFHVEFGTPEEYEKACGSEYFEYLR